MNAWAFGDALVVAGKRTEGVGVPLTFLARQRNRHRWQVALQGTKLFKQLLRLSPRALMPSSIWSVSQSPTGNSQAGGAGGGGPAFSLPWAEGQTWSLWQGPHNTNGITAKPWTSLDFAGGDGVVRAAADGVVYRPCGNLVVIDHGGGWETGYYHLMNITVGQGQVVSRGAALGHIGQGTGCGGHAQGAHVHFSIYHFPSSVGTHTAAVWHLPSDDIGAIGEVVGGWLVQDGRVASSGCLQRISDGARQCAPSAHIFNDGTSGNGKAVGPPPITAPSQQPQGSTPAPTRPAPPGTYPHHVYHTCANGACGLRVRTGPGLTAAVTAVLQDGDQVNIACQTRGDAVSGRDGSSSNVWDRLDGGGFVSDYYVDTPGVHGGFSPPIPECQAPPPPTAQPVTHYNCPATPNGFGHYVPAGKHWGNDFIAQGSTITGGSLSIGANNDGQNHQVRIGIFTGGPFTLAGELGEATVNVIGYGGVSFTFPQPVHVSPGQSLWLAAIGVGDFTAYDQNNGGTDGCFVGSLHGYA